MKVGDLERDEFGNIGMIIDVRKFGNGPAAQVQFGAAPGYDDSQPWILQHLLEMINEIV